MTEVSRAVLPIPDRPEVGLTTYDAKDPDTHFPPIEPLLPPRAPECLIVLLDDIGFGASSAFGGPCHTPTAERLAGRGLKYTRFHTTALCARPVRPCSPAGTTTRSAWEASPRRPPPLRGRVRFDRIPRPRWPMTLKLNGYSTAQFGKCHEVPVWQSSPMGPFDMWPSGGGGFEYFYGFIGGENNQWYPALYEGLTPIEPEKTPEEGYHLTEDLADHAIDWVRTQKALVPDKPFFMYFAPGATHAPHHVPQEWADKYRGQFAHGWDRQRELTFARQKELGVIGPGRQADRSSCRDPGLGRHARGAATRPGTGDGGLRRVLGAHRPPRRPGRRCHRAARHPRQHADLLHHR